MAAKLAAWTASVPAGKSGLKAAGRAGSLGARELGVSGQYRTVRWGAAYEHHERNTPDLLAGFGSNRFGDGRRMER